MLKDIFNDFTNEKIMTNSDILVEKRRDADAASQRVEPHRPPKERFRELIGKNTDYPESIGDHPDFDELGLDETEYHYIVSVFLDIKGSTRLATELPLEEVKFIKNGVLVTAIDIFQVFDGHIHRLQGDAVFALFGRKDIKKSNAIIDALNATSFLQYYFNNELAKAFEEEGLPPIKIRVGLDFGNDDDVLWSNYGIKNVNEITTTSINTDLAAKLESKAPANSIMIGDNIKTFLDLPEEFCKIKEKQVNGERREERYIMDNQYLRYKMWEFDWEKYLNYFSFLEKQNYDYSYKPPKFFEVKCYYKLPGEDEYSHEYKSNCESLPKEVELRYELNIKIPFDYDNIMWEINNRGEEAEEDDNEKIELDNYKNKKYCKPDTVYKGHHYMRCIIKYQGRIVGEEKFGIYVRD